MGQPKSSNKWIQQNTDNSASTKLITYMGEVEDFVQFGTMTGFSDGLNAAAHHGFGKENYIPNYGLGVLDVFSYGVMWHLAGIREGKFKDRRSLLSDKNDPHYYIRTAHGLYHALNKEELALLNAQRIRLTNNPKKLQVLQQSLPEINAVVDSPFINDDDKMNMCYIVHLLKYDAKLIHSKNLPAARTELDTWHGIFEKAKLRPAFASRVYVKAFHAAFNKSNNEIQKPFEHVDQANKTIKDYQRNFVYVVLNKYKLPSYAITKKDAENFIAKAAYLELMHSEDDITAHHRALLGEYRIPTENQDIALQYLNDFFAKYNSLQDGNDNAFYKANLRGIQQEEDFRTQFKSRLFGTVKNCAALATLYSAGTFVTSVFYEISKHEPLPISHMIAPLFLVGATSLVDEVSDLYFKTKKYFQSKDDLENWERANKEAKNLFPLLGIQNAKHRDKYSKDDLAYYKKIYDSHQNDQTRDRRTLTDQEKLAYTLYAPYHPVNLDTTQKTALNTFYNANTPAIYAYYLGASKEGEAFNLEKFGLMYLRAKYQEHKELKERLSRRETKLFQACCSFTGVFLGVLISWAVSILTLCYDMPSLVTKLSFVGFSTIGMAGFAGGVMVKYQMGQNNKKVAQGEENLEKAKLGLFTAYPGLLTHAPREIEPASVTSQLVQNKL